MVEPNGTVLSVFYIVLHMDSRNNLHTDILLPVVHTCFPLHFTILKIKAFPVWTTHDSVLPDWEIYCTKWIFMILLVSSFFLEHGELHIFFHSMLLTEDVIVVRTISGICDWILWIETIYILKLVH